MESNDDSPRRPFRRERRTRPAYVVMSVAILVLVAGVVILGIGYHKSRSRYFETRQAEENLRGQFNRAVESIAEIQEGLDEIIPAEDRLVRLSHDAEMGSTIDQSQKERIFDSIANLKQSIDASKQKIRQLESDLENSKVEVTGLRRIIDNLKRTVTEREAMIASLATRIDSLTVTVDGLRADVARGEERIAQQRNVIAEKSRELGTIFYVVGTKDELKAKGIITETGGILGLRKSVQVSGEFNASDFASLDTDRFNEVIINGREPRVLSAQARSSYEVHVSGDRAILTITDVSEFRKVKYLVIMVK